MNTGRGGERSTIRALAVDKARSGRGGTSTGPGENCSDLLQYLLCSRSFPRSRYIVGIGTETDSLVEFIDQTSWKSHKEIPPQKLLETLREMFEKVSKVVKW